MDLFKVRDVPFEPTVAGRYEIPCIDDSVDIQGGSRLLRRTQIDAKAIVDAVQCENGEDLSHDGADLDAACDGVFKIGGADVDG